MSFEKARKQGASLALRLALLHAIIFAIASLSVFLIFYFVLASQIQQRTDASLIEQVRECSTLLSTQGIQAVKTEIGNAAEAAGTRDLFFRVFTEDGQEIASSKSAEWAQLSIDQAAIHRALGGNPVFDTQTVRGQGNVRVNYSTIGASTVLQIAQSLRDDERLMSYLQMIFGVGLALVSLVAVIIGWLTASRALAKVRAVTQTAIDISNGAISYRVPEGQRSDEIDQLAAAFNKMLDRIALLMGGMREVTDNLAHELRSPIARMRGIAETALTGEESFDDYKNVAVSTVENCDHMLNLMNTTLDVSEAEAGMTKITKSPINLAKTVADISELFRYVAEEKGVALLTNIPSHCEIHGDLPRLQRSISNLLDNAIKYTPAQGRVSVTLTASDSNAAISFEDTGVGIGENDVPKIFQRFYRCDESRSTRGNGLGLSLARALVRAHGGDISVKSTLGSGSTFTISLPNSRI